MEIITLLVVIAALAIAGVVYYLFRPPRRPRTESLYTDALNAMVRGETSTALGLFREVVRHNTEHVEAYLQIGDLLRSEGHHQQAIKIHQSLTVRPNLADAVQIDIHKSLALDYVAVADLSRARREAEQVLKLERRNIWATEFLLDLAEREKDWDRAVQLARTTQRIKNLKDPVQLARFQVYQGLDKMDRYDSKGARQCFDRAVKLAPEYGLPHLHQGDLHAAAGDLVKAIDSWEQFALLAPKESRRVFSKIESALYDLGRFSEVEKFYRRVLEKDDHNLDALAKLSNVLDEKGDHQAALQLVEETLAKFTDSLPVRLMKLKLSLKVSPPHELAHQIDTMVELLIQGGQEP